MIQFFNQSPSFLETGVIRNDNVGRIHPILSSWKAWAMALAVTAVVLPIIYKTMLAEPPTPNDLLSIAKRIAGSNASTDILPLTTANPDRRMGTTDVTKLLENNSLHEINGNSIAEIQARGRSRFFGETESFLEILKEDAKTVRTMGITHIEIADHLEAIRKIITDNGIFCSRNISSHQEKELVLMSQDLFSRPKEIFGGFPSLSDVVFYDPNWLKDNTIGKKTQSQLLLACKSSSFGVIQDIFAKYKGPWPGTSAEIAKETSWSGNIEIINPINGVRLTIGDGVIDYIRKYGFYEGRGDDGHNPYRADPVDIVAVLTGKNPAVIRAEALSQPYPKDTPLYRRTPQQLRVMSS